MQADIVKRLALSSTLLFFSPAYQLVIALAVSITTTAASKELNAFPDHRMDFLYHSCGW